MFAPHPHPDLTHCKQKNILNAAPSEVLAAKKSCIGLNLGVILGQTGQNWDLLVFFYLLSSVVR